MLKATFSLKQRRSAFHNITMIDLELIKNLIIFGCIMGIIGCVGSMTIRLKYLI